MFGTNRFEILEKNVSHEGESPVVWAIISSICTLVISAFIFPEKIVIDGMEHLSGMAINALVGVLSGLLVSFISAVIAFRYSRVTRLVDLAVNSVNSIKLGSKNGVGTMNLESWMQCNSNLSQIQKRFEESGQFQLSQAVAEMKVRCKSALKEHSSCDVRKEYLNEAVNVLVFTKVSWIGLFKTSPITTGIPSLGYD